MTAADTGDAAHSPDRVPRWATLLLATAAALEFLGGLSDLPVFFGESSEILGSGLGGFIIRAKIALHPVFALAALTFAASNQTRHALVAMAAVVFLTWLDYLPALANHAPEFAGAGGVFTLIEVVLAPVLAAAIASLAWLGTRLSLATVLAVIPTVVSVFVVLLFAMGVAIYGL